MTQDPAKPKGKLLALAAGADDPAPLRHALAAHGARTLHVLHVGHGAEPPRGRVYDQAGADEVHVTTVRSREDAEEPDLLARVARSDAILLTGARPLRVTNLLGGSSLLAAVEKAYHRGALVAAAEGATAALGSTMMTRADRARGGGPDEGVLVTPGLGLLPNALLDTHFAAKGRFDRVLEVVTRNPCQVAFGLCDGTAVLVHDGETLEARGQGGVIVVDGHDLGHSSIPRGAAALGPIAAEHLVVHVLLEGYRYDLAQLRYVPPQAPPRGARPLAYA